MSNRTKMALIVLVVVLAFAFAFASWQSRAAAQTLAGANKSAAEERPTGGSDGGPTG